MTATAQHFASHTPPPRTAEPLALRATRAAFRIGGRVAPGFAALRAWDLFATPRRHPEPPREAELLAGAERFTVAHGDGRLAAFSWGRGPAVLLVHGWDGRGAQLGAFVAPLVAAGFRVVGFDAPAHGRSPGRRTNLYDFAAAVEEVAAACGPLHAVVAHSFGAACSTLALSRGLAAGRAVYLAPACRLEGAVDRFAAAIDLPPVALRRFRRLMEERFGANVWRELSGEALAPGFRIPALIVHDREDREVPWEEGAALAKAWPGASFMTTFGLGHRRLLREERILAATLDFLTPAHREESAASAPALLEAAR